MIIFTFYRNVMNVSKIPPMIDDTWATVTSSKDDIYTDKPIVKKKTNKKDVSIEFI